MLRGGYSLGVWAVDHPAWQKEIEQARTECESVGIDFRVKEFLGIYKGRIYGTYKYNKALGSDRNDQVECRTTELLINPGGNIHRCHSDLYAGRTPVGNLPDPAFRINEDFRSCEYFGCCNPCDVKTKTNRFQQFGHTSVEIKFSGDYDEKT